AARHDLVQHLHAGGVQVSVAIPTEDRRQHPVDVEEDHPSHPGDDTSGLTRPTAAASGRGRGTPVRAGGGDMTGRRRPWMILLGLLLAAPLEASAFDLLRSEEATIADIHAALGARTLTCRALVQMYLDRIEAYDRKGPALNAIVITNPDALKVA